MKKSHWSVTDYLAMSVAVTAILAALSAIYPGWPKVWKLISSDSAASWAQAVGGVGAIIVALYLANRSDRAARAAEFDKARIVAASLLVDVSRLGTVLEELRKIDPEAVNRETIQKVGKLLSEFDHLKKVLTQQAALQLAPLPGRCGYRLALGMQILSLIQTRASRLELNTTAQTDNSSRNAQILRSVFNLAEAAYPNIKTATTIIQEEVGHVFDDWHDAKKS